MASQAKDTVYAGMTNVEKIECAINKLRVFGSTTYVEDLVDDIKDKKNTLLVADSELLIKYVASLVKDLPNISALTFEGYFVDVSQKLYIKNTADAITEIARRLEQFYIYGNQAGNMLTSEFMDVNNIYKLAEYDLKDYKYLRLLPVRFRVKFKDSNKRTILKLCDYGQNLLPFVIDEGMGSMSLSEIKDAIADYKEELERDDSEDVPYFDVETE